MRRQFAIFAIALLPVAACNNTSEETRQPTTPTEGAPAAGGGAEGSDGVEGGVQGGAGTATVSPEQLDQVDRFFRRKVGMLQFHCYNEIAEAEHKKFQGNVDLYLEVQPGGKATAVKITKSTLGSPEIEKCITTEVKTWEWPDVPMTVPYTGQVQFKPAW